MLDRILALRKRRADYRAVFETPQGRRVLADLRRFCLYDATVEGHTADRTHVNIGQRNVFLHIQRVLNVDPDALERQIEESKE